MSPEAATQYETTGQLLSAIEHSAQSGEKRNFLEDCRQLQRLCGFSYDILKAPTSIPNKTTVYVWNHCGILPTGKYPYFTREELFHGDGPYHMTKNALKKEAWFTSFQSMKTTAIGTMAIADITGDANIGWIVRKDLPNYRKFLGIPIKNGSITAQKASIIAYDCYGVERENLDPRANWAVLRKMVKDLKDGRDLATYAEPHIGRDLTSFDPTFQTLPILVSRIGPSQIIPCSMWQTGSSEHYKIKLGEPFDPQEFGKHAAEETMIRIALQLPQTRWGLWQDKAMERFEARQARVLLPQVDGQKR